MTDSILSPARQPEDADAALRPKTLAEFVGQAAAKDNLRVFIESARSRREAMDHVLFFGPPGLGKTTLAQIVARELGVGFRATSGPVIAKAGDLAALLTTPLRDRFGIPVRLTFYSVEELERVVVRGASLLGIGMDAEGAREIARRARGTPRVAGRLLRRVRDFAHVAGDGTVTRAIADAALTRLEVDHLGLDAMDRRYLRMIAEIYKGGPVGVETLAAALAEQRDVLEEVIEPFLIQRGLLQRTPRGRMLADQGWRYLGLAPPRRAEAQLDLLSEIGGRRDD